MLKNIYFLSLWQSSRINGQHILFENSAEEVSGMDSVRAIAIDADFQAEGEDAAFGYSELYLNFESNKVGFQNLSNGE